MRVTINKRGHSSQGNMVRVEVRDIGKWKLDLLTLETLFSCPIILTVLASTEKEAIQSARKTAHEEGWTVVLVTSVEK